jgi:hypothetical protein
VIAVVLLALPAAAGEICVDPQSYYLPCPPGDVLFLFPSTGFNTSGEPCTVESEGWLRILVSSSATDPHVNAGDPDGFRLYLWMIPNFASASAGYGFGHVTLWFQDTLGIANYLPYSEQGWNPDNLSLSFGGCEPEDNPPSLLGEFWVLPTPVEQTSFGEVKSAYR